jgi:hypothetical protein
MRKSVELSMEMHDAIKDEVSKRISTHQVSMRRMQAGQTILSAGGVPQPSPLVLLALGDSWFDYPLAGNSISFGSTDIIAQLTSLGTINPMVLNLSHFGDSTREEIGLTKQQRMVAALNDPSNWGTSGKPDAILFSGGGDDIAGNQFCIFIDFALPGATGLNTARFNDALAGIRAGYLDLFAFRDRFAPGVPVFAHCYDFPIPNGTHPACAGPWLKPSIDFLGWSMADGTRIVKDALTQFRNMLKTLEADAKNNFTLIDTQGTLSPSDWANELHPFPDGFKSLAELFVASLRVKFPGRI